MANYRNKKGNRRISHNEHEKVHNRFTTLLERKTDEQMRMVLGPKGEYVLPEELQKDKPRDTVTRSSSKNTCRSRQDTKDKGIDAQSVDRVLRLAEEQKYIKSRKFLEFQTPSGEGENYKPLLPPVEENEVGNGKSAVSVGSSSKSAVKKEKEPKVSKRVVSKAPMKLDENARKKRRKGTPMRAPYSASFTPGTGNGSTSSGMEYCETEYPNHAFINGWYNCGCGEAICPSDIIYHKCPYTGTSSKYSCN